MARKKIFEHKAKQLLFDTLDLPYSGLAIHTGSRHSGDPPAGGDSRIILESDSGQARMTLDGLDQNKKYVLKVDQGIKGRMKKGLVKLALAPSDIPKAVKEITSKGYSQFILEEMADVSGGEKYISFERIRDGIKVLYAEQGGIEIESNKNVQELVVKDENDEQLKELNLPQVDLKKIIKSFNVFQFSFLEINPFIIHNSRFIILDSAVEVDTAGEFFAKGTWSEEDFATHNAHGLTIEEKNVETLAKKSQASFNLTVLNKNGSIFLLLSGGGASIVVADEAAALGHGESIANYGEYSGNPNEEETYIYTKNVLSLMLKSRPKADPPVAGKTQGKVLILAGGVANFTDVKATFKGIIRAFDEVKSDMAQQGIKVYVRRGGPNQKAGLAHMKKYLEENNLYGHVEGPELVLTDIVKKAIQSTL